MNYSDYYMVVIWGDFRESDYSRDVMREGYENVRACLDFGEDTIYQLAVI